MYKIYMHFKMDDGLGFTVIKSNSFTHKENITLIKDLVRSGWNPSPDLIL